MAGTFNGSAVSVLGRKRWAGKAMSRDWWGGWDAAGRQVKV
jgi:hypothetical protein